MRIRAAARRLHSNASYEFVSLAALMAATACGAPSADDRARDQDARQAVGRTSQAVASTPPTQRHVAVIMFNFADDVRQPLSVDDMRQEVFTGVRSTNAFMKDASWGLVELTGNTRSDGDIYGWYQLNHTTPVECPPPEWSDEAQQLAARDGYNPANYKHTVFFWPNLPNCGFLGLGGTPGETVGINGGNAHVIAHELGHNLGLPHSDALACWDAASNPTPLGTNCEIWGNADPFCTMGSGELRQYSAYQKGKLGWLAPSNLVTLANDGTVELAPMEDPTSQVQSLRIPRDGDTYYYIEARHRVGVFDSRIEESAETGVLLRVAPDYADSSKAPALIDTHPGNESNEEKFLNAPLQVGETFIEPGRGISIRLDARTPDLARVSVRFPPPDGNDGGGIRGEYFPGPNLSGTPVVRVDPTIAFNWHGGAPVTGVPADSFSVRWTGQIKPRYSETYRFYTISDDGVRLWVNNQLIIDDWNGHFAKENHGSIKLDAGARYDIRLEYFEDVGDSSAKLLWESPTQLREIIPRTRLYPTTGTTALPGAPKSPFPSHLATSMATGLSMSWTGGQNSTSHEIYVSTQREPQFLQATTTTSYSLNGLQPNTTYFWQIVERNASGATPGPIWQFTTRASGTTLFSDNFESGSLSRFTQTSGSWSIVSDGSRVLRQTNATTDARILVNFQSLTDQMVSARVNPLTFSVPNAYIALLARVQSATNYYSAAVGGNGRIELRSVRNGVSSTLGQKMLAVSTNRWHDLRLEAVGSSLRFYVDGLLQLTVSDSNLTSGQPGLATSSATASFDDVIVSR